MKLPFLDREAELHRLRAALGRRRSSLVCLYGRRRCGKSRLLQEALRGEPAVYYVGDDRHAPLQLRAVAGEIARLVPGFDHVVYPGWDELLERWWREAPAGAVLALDEFPALAAAAPELPSLLQKRVDRIGGRPRHVLLCGSSQRRMQGLVLDRTAPLFGRSEEILKVGPLGLAEVRRAFRCPDAVRTVEAFALWGGVPRYWELALDRPDRETALRELVLDPMGVLYEEPARLLLDDLRDSTQASSILSLIGQGCHRVSEIGARLNTPATSLSRPLSRLMDLGFVARDVPFGASVRDSKRSFYRISDPFLRFWYAFVEPNRSRLEMGQIEPVQAGIAARWADHLGEVWEELSRASLGRLEIAGTRWLPGARWWGAGLSGERLEIDVVAAAVNDSELVLVGEAKLQCRAAEVSGFLAGLEKKARDCPVLQGRRVIPALWLLRPPGGRRDGATVITGEQVVGGT